MRIAWFIHGRGRGHASRSSSIIERVRNEGHHVTVHAGGQALDLLATDPYLVPTTPVLPGLGVLTVTPRRVAEDRRFLQERRVQLVVSDGDMPSVLAARSARVPALAVGHDLVFSRCRLPAGLHAPSLRAQRVNAAHLSLASHGVAVHFLPIAAAHPGILTARPDLRQGLRTSPEDHGHILAYFRDDNGHQALRHLVAAGRRVLLFGTDHAPEGVTARPFDCDAFAEALRTAHAVIGSAGSNLLAECVALGKSILALHRDNDAEQRLNGELLTRAGAGFHASLSRVTPELVDRFLRAADARTFTRIPLLDVPSASDAFGRLLRMAEPVLESAPSTWVGTTQTLPPLA